VLELTWKRLQGLWNLSVPRRVFDLGLRRGEGPPEIRARDGLYYAHGRVCPAYRGGECSVYGSWLKPPGCSDFPLYEEDGGLVADLRCEAVDLEEVEEELRRALGPGNRVERCPNPEFPFLVTMKARRSRRDGHRRGSVSPSARSRRRARKRPQIPDL